MLSYLLRRVIYMILLLLILSFVAFVIIELPPGDYLSTLIMNMKNRGLSVDQEQILNLERFYGLDKPMYQRYFKWVLELMQGDMGFSMRWNKPVNELIGDRFLLTVTLSLATLVFVYVVAVPIGIYSATHQYSPGDYVATVFGFIGLATPNFLLALLLMFLFVKYTNWSVGGLFTFEYQLAPWSFGKVIDLLKHLPIPLVVIGTSGTAGLIRVLRGTLLDELSKQYVITARAKGVHETRLLFRYPVRIAVNPIISGIGGILPMLVSGATLTAIVLNLPTIGPLLLQALQAQDMYLAGSMIMLLGALSMVGTLISDVLLVIVDPRIRFEAKAKK